jgi:hypothetical protein
VRHVKAVDHFVDLRLKAHIEHAIRLIQDKILHGREAQLPVVQDVDQPARRRNQNVKRIAKLAKLIPHRRTAKNTNGLQIGTLSKLVRLRLNLKSKLPRRNKDNNARIPRPGTTGESRQNRKHVSGGFATPGLAGNDKIMGSEDIGNGILLNIRGCAKAKIGHRNQNVIADAASRELLDGSQSIELGMDNNVGTFINGHIARILVRCEKTTNAIVGKLIHARGD